ncbi:RcnB family protein [Pantoea sp. MBD-2R]|uniref:RcnB family protein n=1 Tax=unclassified Pantoea TaxID=2630326 RepID=UPI0011BFD852|nr:RcnB family protein [Pantoea sp. CCBC3-3-1]
MKKSGIIALSALLFATTSLSAFAEGPQQGPDGHQQQPVKRPPQNNQHGGQPNEQHGGQQHDQRGHEPQPQHNAEHRPAQHGDFRKGRPLPEKYRGEGYQVNDWRKHGLKAPPAGHRWQNIDGNYVLIAVATGVITSVIAHH